MAGKFTAGTPNTLEKVWNIDVEGEYRNYHRKLKTIKNVHTPAEHNNHVSLLFRRDLKRI